jgi:hypothetical protein
MTAAAPEIVRTHDEARSLIDVAMMLAHAQPRPRLPELVAFVDEEHAAMLGSARAWARLGFSVEPEWTRRLISLESLLRLLKLIEANEKAVMRALKGE